MFVNDVTHIVLKVPKLLLDIEFKQVFIETVFHLVSSYFQKGVIFEQWLYCIGSLWKRTSIGWDCFHFYLYFPSQRKSYVILTSRCILNKKITYAHNRTSPFSYGLQNNCYLSVSILNTLVSYLGQLNSMIKLLLFLILSNKVI